VKALAAAVGERHGACRGSVLPNVTAINQYAKATQGTASRCQGFAGSTIGRLRRVADITIRGMVRLIQVEVRDTP
jgi:hypothetical protein